MIVLELRKLRALRRTYLGLGGAAIIPLILLVALQVGDGGPPDSVPFARAVTTNGFAIPLFSLAFATFFLLPLLASLVAGDVISGEVASGTLKTVLTRSVTRARFFWAKIGTAALYTLALMLAQAIAGTVAGVVVLGTDPLPTLSGTQVGPSRALLLIAGAFLIATVSVFAVACFAILLSALTHNTVAAIGGTIILIVVLQVMASFASLSFLRPYLVTEQANSWFGLLRDPIDWWPIARAGLVAFCWAAPCLLIACASFLRRDVLS